MEALLQHGAKSLLRDCRGRTPIHLSAACGHIGVLGALLQSATSVDAIPAIADNHGYTSLHWACYNGKHESMLGGECISVGIVSHKGFPIQSKHSESQLSIRQ